MYKILLLALVYTTLAFGQQKEVSAKIETVEINESSSYKINGTAEFNLTYCGGIAPVDYVLEKYEKHRKLKNSKIIFRLVDNPDTYNYAITDSSGNFNVRLSKGEWRYFLTKSISEKNKDLPLSEMKDCDLFYTQAYGTILIDSDTSDLNILFRIPCNPCYPNNRP